MGTHEQPPHIEQQDIKIPTIELSADKVRQIVFWGHFSQGSIGLQQRIFDYLTLEHPQWRAALSANEQAEIATNIADSVTQMVTKVTMVTI